MRIEADRPPRIEFEGLSYEIPADKIRLNGAHNYFDIAMVYGVCRLAA